MGLGQVSPQIPSGFELVVTTPYTTLYLLGTDDKTLYLLGYETNTQAESSKTKQNKKPARLIFF